MKRVVVIAALLTCTAAPAAAQTEGRVSVGGSVTVAKPTDSDMQTAVGVGPLVRLNPKKGWGIAAGLSWFRTDLDNPSGADGAFAHLRVRPLMAGVSYTVGQQPVLVSFSVVAGPSFNSVELDAEFLNRLPAGTARPAIDVNNSFAVRPGLGVTVTLAPRVALVGFGGYSINRPDVVYRDSAGQEIRDRWKANTILLSVGAVYSLF